MLNKKFQSYLAFMWNQDVFCYKALPIGLCTAPAVFTGIYDEPSCKNGKGSGPEYASLPRRYYPLCSNRRGMSSTWKVALQNSGTSRVPDQFQQVPLDPLSGTRVDWRSMEQPLSSDNAASRQNNQDSATGVQVTGKGVHRSFDLATIHGSCDVCSSGCSTLRHSNETPWSYGSEVELSGQGCLQSEVLGGA